MDLSGHHWLAQAQADAEKAWFTWADVDMLRGGAPDAPKSETPKMLDLADRIAALLPPRQAASESGE